MGRPNVATAIKLLTKAQSTNSESEAIALVERSYGMLAQMINVYDTENAGGPRRRERRRLLERRRRNRAQSGGVESQTAAGVRAADSIAQYRGVTGDADAPRSGVDVSL